MTAEDNLLFDVNNSPHVRDADSTPRIMYTVCLALAPALVWAILVFGWRALALTVASVAACAATESLCVWWRGQPNTLRDGSAIVTGILLAMVSPSNLPIWAICLGGVFSIAIGKQVFGGLGHNIWNPALLGRAFMQISMPSLMMSSEWPYLGVAGKWWNNILYTLSGSFDSISAGVKSAADVVTGASSASAVTEKGVDVVSAATALSRIHQASGEVINGVNFPPEALSPTWQDIIMTWLGAEGGSMGEVSAVLLVLGGLFLINRKIISWDIPVFFLGTVAVIAFVVPPPYKIGDVMEFGPWFRGPALLHLGAGGLMLGAFFMATDMVTKPLTQTGRIIFAVGCGAVTMLIRLFAGYPEGVCYAILFMNTCVPFIDILTRPKVFGKKYK